MEKEDRPAARQSPWGELGSEELLARVRLELDALDMAALRQILGSPYLTEKVVSLLLEKPEARGSYEVRRLVAASPKTPLARALQLVPGLYWRDLLELARDMRAPAVVRRSAERYLVDRMVGMAVGERISLARLATGLVLQQLRHESHPRVVAALLENPRLTEGVLLPMASSATTAPEILKLLAGSGRWGNRYPIQVALSRNPKTPVPVALRLLSGLKRQDRKAVASNLRLPEATRRRARILLGESP